MGIENYFNTPFSLTTLTTTKVDGRNKEVYTLDPVTYSCAVFTPSTEKIVRVGTKDYVIQKTIYCKVTVPVEHGDYITVDDNQYSVGNIMNTNNRNHHYQISLIKRVK